MNTIKFIFLLKNNFKTETEGPWDEAYSATSSTNPSLLEATRRTRSRERKLNPVDQ